MGLDCFKLSYIPLGSLVIATVLLVPGAAPQSDYEPRLHLDSLPLNMR